MKTRDFLMFSGGIKRGQWDEMDLKIQINSFMLMLPSYRNQSVYLQSKSIDQFLCNGATLAFIEFSQMLNVHYTLY